MKRRQKLNTLELKKQSDQKKLEQKRSMKIEMKTAVIDSRIQIWKKHLEDVKNQNAARV